MHKLVWIYQYSTSLQIGHGSDLEVLSISWSKDSSLMVLDHYCGVDYGVAELYNAKPHCFPLFPLFLLFPLITFHPEPAENTNDHVWRSNFLFFPFFEWNLEKVKWKNPKKIKKSGNSQFENLSNIFRFFLRFL